MCDPHNGLPGHKSRNVAAFAAAAAAETILADWLAAREGLEPPTLALGKPCSIRLSYRAARGG